MGQRAKRRVVIVGGGTAGWMTAAALVDALNPRISVQLIESPEIGIVGVGEATFPHLRLFLRRLGIDEAAFMAATHATFKLGIVFNDFGALGEEYMHGFAGFGEAVAGVPFYHYWLRMHRHANGAAIGDYSIAVAAARARRFHPPCAELGGEAAFSYAYQFDATRFAPFLRDFACARGVDRVEATVRRVERDADSGDVVALELGDGRRIEGDLFVDCSGFRSLLLGETLEEGWESWSDWLPCDRAVAMPCGRPAGEIEPFTRAIGMPSGWRWRIPLQHRLGNGYVFSSAHVSEDEATAQLAAVLEGEPLADPRILKFRPGRRMRAWSHNVIGIGLAAGFLEPMESTSIYLVQVAIDWLLELFPIDAVDPQDRATFNELIDFEYARIRDFLILHYHATRRDDSPFWNRMRTMEIPESLADRLALWRQAARIPFYGRGPFLEPSWVSVLLGQGIRPEVWDARAQLPDAEKLRGAMLHLKGDIDRRVYTMPGHSRFLQNLLGQEDRVG
ncbi:tryptophan halogenase family protein [Sphingomonas pituitosa]|uniref:tryptophan halogenase family protein n=1 Tax=Sphingomonas pituitosa TaxID=99597 RepID=UPI0008356D93|nr:tryptophan halogenase family protein [Sphingomonas pituitosa]